jgi:hypothetical protein
METNKSENKVSETLHTPFSQTFFHGTKADLKPGDFIETGINSNFGQGNKAKYIYLTATLDAAIWGAELALGEARERIYLVEPTGPIEDDPNLTDRKFPGNQQSLTAQNIRLGLSARSLSGRGTRRNVLKL